MEGATQDDLRAQVWGDAARKGVKRRAGLGASPPERLRRRRKRKEGTEADPREEHIHVWGNGQQRQDPWGHLSQAAL